MKTLILLAIRSSLVISVLFAASSTMADMSILVQSTTSTKIQAFMIISYR